MPSKFPLIPLTPYRGMNKKDDKYRLVKGDLFSASNVLCNDDGSIERTDGYTDQLTPDLGASNPCLSVFEWEKLDGATEVIFVFNTLLKALNSVTGEQTDLKTGLSADKKFRLVTYEGYAYGGNQFDNNQMLLPSYTHKLARGAVSTTDATDLPTVKTLANAIKSDMNTHLASTTQHNAVDSTNTIGFTDLVGGDSQATTNTAVNEIKTDLNAHRSQSGIHPTNDAYHLVEAANASDLATSITLINEIKKCYNQHIGDCRLAKWTITAPTTAPTTADGGAGTPNGAYYHYYTFYNKIDGVESAPSATSALLTIASKQITVSAMDVSTDPQVTHKRIYRTVASGATFYRVAEITNVTTSYTDNIADSALGVVCPTEGYTTIPNTNIFITFNDRIFLAGDVSDPTVVVYTELTYPWKYSAAYNYQYFLGTITALAKAPNGIIVFERHRMWFWPSAPLSTPPYIVSELIGCTNQDAIFYIGDLVGFVSDSGVYSFDGANLTLMSEDINKELLTKNLESACCVFDTLNQKLYVCVASS